MDQRDKKGEKDLLTKNIICCMCGDKTTTNEKVVELQFFEESGFCPACDEKLRNEVDGR